MKHPKLEHSSLICQNNIYDVVKCVLGESLPDTTRSGTTIVQKCEGHQPRTS